MDPNATLELIAQALRDGDREAAREAAENLSEWIRRGGFPPADPAWTDAVSEALSES
jgi:hypothetical protein